LWLGALAATPLLAGADELLEPLTAWVLQAPTPVRGDDGRTRLTYELHVTNTQEEPLILTSVEVGDAGGRLQLIDRDELPGGFRPFGVSRHEWAKRPHTGPLTLTAGMSGLIYLWVPLPQSRAVSGALRHRIVVESREGAGGPARAIELLPVELSSREPMRIGPPVRGGPWLVSNGPSNISGHRRLAIPLHGRLSVFQRYAIDYLRLDSLGRRYEGDGRANREYFTHGEEAIAVADAVVAKVRDGIVENVPHELPSGAAMGLDTVYGNAVILDLGDGHFAIYAHLLLGTIKVKQHDRVRVGDVLGLIGNSGNSLLPHLHFQLADSARTLSGEGLPYVHASFGVLGKCPRGDEDDAPPCELGLQRPVNEALPLNGSVVTFP
jgi:hypothetical protein